MKFNILLKFVCYAVIFISSSAVSVSNAQNRNKTQALSSIQQNMTACEAYMDPAPVLRTSSQDEENVVHTNFEAVAQQYNNMTGTLSVVKFWGHANPLQGISNTVKVIVYQANLGLPGIILGQTTVVLNTSVAAYPVHATFSSPVTLSSSSIIISVEPQVPLTDDFFVQRNSPPNGGNLNLIKIKQAGQWFNNLAINNGPSYNYDFMILPITEINISAGFNFVINNGSVSFTNTSTGGATYHWDFGDGDTSTAVSPVHNYASSNFYPVKLKAYSNTNECYDSTVQTLNVVVTGMKELQSSFPNQLKIISSSKAEDVLLIETAINTKIAIYDILGKAKLSGEIFAGRINRIDIDQLPTGIYLIKAPGMKTVRFIKS